MENTPFPNEPRNWITMKYLKCVARDCDEEQIKQNYRKLAKKYHPDVVKTTNKEEATEKFQQLTEAYEVLSNPEKRQRYDAFGKLGLDDSNLTDQPMDSVMNPFDLYFSQFGIFDTLFGKANNNNANLGMNGNLNNENVEISIDVTLEELYFGTKREFTKKRKVLCRTCNGTGAFSNENIFFCKSCKGTGRRIIRKTLPRGIIQQFSSTCMDCETRPN
ncbi:hypothetical protein ABK040_013479 [Willaertia magna]